MLGLGRPAWATPRQSLEALADEVDNAVAQRDMRPNLSPQGNAAWLRAVEHYHTRLHHIRHARLDPQSRITYDMLEWLLGLKRDFIEKGEILEDLGSVKSLLLTTYDVVDVDRSDLNDWRWLIKSLRLSARFVDSYIALLEKGLLSGHGQPPEVVRSSIKVLRVLTSKQANRNPFLSLERELEEKLKGRRQLPELRRELRYAVRAIVLPAHERLRDFLAETYLPRTTAKLGQDPERYRRQLEFHVGPGHAPGKLHDWGQREVARLLVELERTARQIDPNLRSLESFMKGLHEQEENRYHSKQELRDHASDEVERALTFADKVAPIPESEIVIDDVPRAEQGTVAAQYVFDAANNVGSFQVNTGKLLSGQQRNDMATLAAHESVPGHHLAAVYAAQSWPNLTFRRDAANTAFDEGWGLYAEQLRDEHYDFTPRERIGYLVGQLWRAARLVVDTGLHTGVMTPRQAVAYFQKATFLARANAAAEIERYINWPGQACAYYVGKTQFLQIRRRVETILGPGFDERAFHAKLLGLGSVPLPLAEKAMVAWAHRSKGQRVRTRARAR